MSINEAGSDEPQRRPSDVARVNGGTETILVVEDETALREVTRAMLERRGYTVLVASDAEQAERIAVNHSERIDLVLTDFVLPSANGRIVAEQLRALRPDIKVLFMSGYTHDTITSQGHVTERGQLLEKPFSDNALASRVRDMLDARVVTPIHAS